MFAPDKNLPLISIATPTLNNGHELERFFKSIQQQKYPRHRIEILIADGGSTDDTVKIAKKYGAVVLHNKAKLAEPGVALAMKHARGELTMILAADNFFFDPYAFRTLARIFSNSSIYVALPKHNSQKNYSVFSKYHNRFTDPFNHFLYGDAANARTFHRIYKTLIHTRIFDVYDFKSHPMKPIMSLSQGMVLRTAYKRSKESEYDDLAPIIDIINQGKLIAYVHSVSVYHDTINNPHHFIKKIRWATKNALDRKNYGIAFRKNTLTQSQRIKVYLWPAYALTFFPAFIVSLYGLVRDRELIWLFHPINCWIAAAASSVQVIQSKLNSSHTVSRQ